MKKRFICKNCGIDHDGLYGSGQFCSKSCKCSFNAKKRKQHVINITNENIQEYTCEYCGKIIKSKCSLQNHKKHFCKKNPNIDLNYGKRKNWICPLCDYIGISRSDLYKHNKMYHPTKNGCIWNKGLTKYTDNRILRMTEHMTITMQRKRANGELVVSDKTKKLQSKRRKEFLSKHPDRHGNKTMCSNRNHMTYPEKITYDWLLLHQIKFEAQFPYKYVWPDGTQHIRYVDFYIIDQNIFIEIDGRYWHETRKDIDAIKDDFANKNGIKTYRLDPAKSIQNQLASIF